FGDAPSPYPTLLSQDGARHTPDPTFYLGATIDGEFDGQPNANATGDDIVPSNTDDEDGIIFLDPIVPGNLCKVQVTATIPPGQHGRIDAWIDFNADGDWVDGNEQIFTAVPVVGGTNVLNFVVPAVAVNGTTFARFRLSRQGDLRFTGLAQDGEVEDYQVQISTPMDFG